MIVAVRNPICPSTTLQSNANHDYPYSLDAQVEDGQRLDASHPTSALIHTWLTEKVALHLHKQSS